MIFAGQMRFLSPNQQRESNEKKRTMPQLSDVLGVEIPKKKKTKTVVTHNTRKFNPKLFHD